MSLSLDLLEQAEHLAKRDPRRPKQVNLRRAASAAYYALFHLLSGSASALFATEPGLAARINRTLNHGEMWKASVMFVNDKFPKALDDKRVRYSTPADLRLVAKTFIDLQDVRHKADYDLTHSFRRHEVVALIQSARRAFDAWERVRKTDDARIYLASFLLWKRWDEDPR